jgi:hypothetical protein
MKICRIKVNARRFCLLHVSQTYTEEQERYSHLKFRVLFRAFEIDVINLIAVLRHMPIKVVLPL